MTHRAIPEDILQKVHLIAQRYRGQTMPVYAEAEQIRRQWPGANIALEDYVEALVEAGKTLNMSFEFNIAQARDALLGITDGATKAGTLHVLHTSLVKVPCPMDRRIGSPGAAVNGTAALAV